MTQTYKVQVSMNQAHIVESGFVWKQGDFGFNIEIEVLDFDTTGATPQIIFRKSTGAVEATQISVANNKFTYAIRGTELDTPGPCVCDLKLNDSTTKRVSTASFKYFVIPDTMDGLEQEASSYSDTIEQLLENTLQKSETNGLVRNDGTIDTVVETTISNQGALIDNLNNAINFSYDGIETFLTHGSFAIGGLNIDGTLLPSQKTRVSSANVDKMSFDRDITVKVKSGYKWGYIPFTGDTPGAWSGWKTNDTIIPQNTSFVVQISKDPEGTATANVLEYVSALTFEPEINKQVNDNTADIIDLKDTVLFTDDEIIPYTDARTADRTENNYRLVISTGLCVSDATYTLKKFEVTAGSIVKITSNGMFQFQNSAIVPGSGTSNRIGKTYESGTFVLKVPEGATWLIVCVLKEGGTYYVYDDSRVWRNGSSFNVGNTDFICPKYVLPSYGANQVAIHANISLDEGEKVYFVLNTVAVDSGLIEDVAAANRLRKGIEKISENESASFALNENEKGYSIQVAKIDNGGTIVPLRISQINQTDINISRYYDQNIGNPSLVRNPNWRNGSSYNTGNQNFIALNTIVPALEAQQITIYADIPLNSGEKVNYIFSTLSKDSGIVDESGSYRIRDNVQIVSENKFAMIELNNNEKGFAVQLCKMDANDTIIPTRITSFDPAKIQINRNYSVKASIESTGQEVKNSKHVRSGQTAPLTFLHFSDLHADTAALSRILAKASEYESLIGDKICTGDIVGNDGEAISNWWDPDILTCIGNHDSAVYTPGTGYDWTGVSMAQRDAWYIAPFESNWGITHTSGTSYYYKDYSTQKVRLIVMDVMLYTDNGDEAAAQTAWLESLLADAITNNLHVVIGIHCPHGGATKTQCSFSSYGTGTMPTRLDCNTPQAVIDVVASKITSGLKFVGYLVGHTHQDDVWDASGDGTQLMYCITCAVVTQQAQWEDSDQHRDSTLDAFNLVTIDTSNTLVKIVRGGGADIDNKMRTRKAICFNYSTGEKIGEIL